MSDPEFKEEKKSEVYSHNMSEAMGAGESIMLDFPVYV